MAAIPNSWPRASASGGVTLPLLFALSLPGCAATSGQFMGIDTTVQSNALRSDPETAVLRNRLGLLVKAAQQENCLVGPAQSQALTGLSGLAYIQCQVRFSELDSVASNLRDSQAEASLGLLARRAQGGDKLAQLKLGIRFEEGDGVERDIEKARTLYSRAATDSGGTLWIYVPGVGNGTRGRVMPIDQGPRQPGLKAAKDRLAKLAAEKSRD